VNWTSSIRKQRNRWVRWILVETAHGASHHDTKMNKLFKRVESRKGTQKAILAVAWKMLVSIYYVLSRIVPWRQLRRKG